MAPTTSLDGGLILTTSPIWSYSETGLADPWYHARKQIRSLMLCLSVFSFNGKRPVIAMHSLVTTAVAGAKDVEGRAIKDSVYCFGMHVNSKSIWRYRRKSIHRKRRMEGRVLQFPAECDMHSTSTGLWRQFKRVVDPIQWLAVALASLR